MIRKKIIKIIKNAKKQEVKLPIKFKSNWIKALKSGKYKQTTAGNLLDSDGYCCLGVAAAICEIGKKHLFNRGFLTNVNCIKTDNKNILFNKIRTRVPKDLRDNLTLQEDLASMNDEGDSFIKIAKYIEKNL